MLEEKHIPLYQKVAAATNAGYVLNMIIPNVFVSQQLHILGASKEVFTAFFAATQLTFSNATERMDELSKPAQGQVMSDLNNKNGAFSLNKMIWHTKAMFILNMDVPKPQSIAFLESLPDNEAYIAYSMTMPTHDPSGHTNFNPACWLALAHEKVEMYSGALRFVDLQLETDVLKGGHSLSKWPQVIALACKGRVLAKLDRHAEALIAFQGAIAMSEKAYSLMEAFALRELANYVAGGDAAVQASQDLEVKLGSFDGRMTRAEFDKLKITP